MHLALNPNDKGQAFAANSDKTISKIDLNHAKSDFFDISKSHKGKIEDLKFCSFKQQSDGVLGGLNPQCLISASDDRLLKLWDPNSGKQITSVQYENHPFYSIDCNEQIIVAGTNEDLVFWDVRNLQIPMEVLDESHSDDITSIKFCPGNN